MKNIKFLILILTVAIVSVSCETYDDYDQDRKPVVGFTAKSKNINGVPSGGEKTETMTLFASEISSEDRQFELIFVPIEDTEANPPAETENYTYNSVVTIPANERIGTINLTGFGISLTSTRTYFRLALKSDPSFVIGNEFLMVGLKGK